MIVVSSSSSAARPVAGVAVKTSSLTAAAALNAEQNEDLSAILVADDGHNDGVEDRVDSEHVETDVGKDVEPVGVDDLVVGQ